MSRIIDIIKRAASKPSEEPETPEEYIETTIEDLYEDETFTRRAN